MLITFTAYILIPVYTLLFVAGSDWFTTNFSVLGNIAGRNEAFVLWGLMVGIYFFVCLRKIFRRMPEKPAGTWLVPLALVLLDFAVTTPYLPEMFPLKAYLHIVFAFLAAACLILCVFLTVLKLYQRDPREYRPYLWGIRDHRGRLCLSFYPGRDRQQRPGDLLYGLHDLDGLWAL